MNDDVRNIVLGLVAAGISATLGWLARTYLWKRKLRRKQRFFGLPENSESLLVVNRDPSTSEPAVHRFDVFTLLELAALIKDCGAHTQVVTQDTVHQGFGERTEFCVGGPISNRRMAAHIGAMLPGVVFNSDPEPGPHRAAFQIGSEQYRLEPGVTEHVLLARLTTGGAELPAPFRNGMFIGQHGSWNRSEFSGYKVVFVPFKDGRPAGPPIDVLTGFLKGDGSGKAYGRPVGVAIDGSGGLLVADDTGNTVWRVTGDARNSPTR